MSTPQQRVHDATRSLLALLEHGESLSPEAIALRCELAEATAEAGHLDDAYYQVEELLRDARREHGPDHPAVARARAAVEAVREIGFRAQAADGTGDEPADGMGAERADVDDTAAPGR